MRLQYLFFSLMTLMFAAGLSSEEVEVLDLKTHIVKLQPKRDGSLAFPPVAYVQVAEIVPGKNGVFHRQARLLGLSMDLSVAELARKFLSGVAVSPSFYPYLTVGAGVGVRGNVFNAPKFARPVFIGYKKDAWFVSANAALDIDWNESDRPSGVKVAFPAGLKVGYRY